MDMINALTNVLKYIDREPWGSLLEEVVSQHIYEVLEAFSLDYDELPGILGENTWFMVWGCILEDFLSQPIGDNGQTVLDEYIKRRGWRERPQHRSYISALSRSVMSLYEICEIRKGQGIKVRDMLRDGEAVWVNDVSASTSASLWEVIAARVIRSGGKTVFTGAVLPFAPETARELQNEIEFITGMRSNFSLSRLKGITPLFTQWWLLSALDQLLGHSLPVICNSDGEEMVLHEICYPLNAGITQKAIAEQLKQLPVLRQENSKRWLWLSEEKSTTPMSISELKIDGSGILLGSIKLKGRTLILSVNSENRGAKGASMLEGVLGNMVRQPLTSIQTLQQVMENRPVTSESKREEIPTEVITPLIHARLDQHYRQILDEPIEMLGGKPPREAVKSDAGRMHVIEWLKHLEYSSSGLPDKDPVASYDFIWMWKELGVIDFRK